MSRVPVGVDQQILYVAARRVLLDALTALYDHRDALILVGAQAVYIHAADAELGVAAFTSDGDLVIDPALLGEDPLVDEAMSRAGFARNISGDRGNPGLWWKQQTLNEQPVNIEVDLLVPHSLTDDGRGRRSANIPPHPRGTFLRVPGLEATVVDNTVMTLPSLEPDIDSRSVETRVAGPTALLIAKAIKVSERLADAERRPGRSVDKDAGDIVALMMTADVETVAATMNRLLGDPRAGDATRTGLDALHRLFGSPRTDGVEMAVRALSAVPGVSPAALAPAFMAQLPQL
ncbi:hypothetical protein [Kineosporia sp. A_224]|uniref:hypothetical protein n=1 Tax=Kineosporia sp. A_224 TaxID=1962180 RepID=UPI000B4ACE74|nr:hypothetical protein [Kineosporia sp. A_224]